MLGDAPSDSASTFVAFSDLGLLLLPPCLRVHVRVGPLGDSSRRQTDLNSHFNGGHGCAGRGGETLAQVLEDENVPLRVARYVCQRRRAQRRTRRVRSSDGWGGHFFAAALRGRELGQGGCGRDGFDTGEIDRPPPPEGSPWEHLLRGATSADIPQIWMLLRSAQGLARASRLQRGNAWEYVCVSARKIARACATLGASCQRSPSCKLLGLVVTG